MVLLIGTPASVAAQALKDRDVDCEVVRVLDHDIKPGRVTPATVSGSPIVMSMNPARRAGGLRGR